MRGSAVSVDAGTPLGPDVIVTTSRYRGSQHRYRCDVRPEHLLIFVNNLRQKDADPRIARTATIQATRTVAIRGTI